MTAWLGFALIAGSVAALPAIDRRLAGAQLVPGRADAGLQRRVHQDRHRAAHAAYGAWVRRADRAGVRARVLGL